MPKFEPLYSDVLPMGESVILRASRGTAESEPIAYTEGSNQALLISPSADPAPADFVWFTLSTFALVALICLVFSALWAFKEIVGIVFFTLIAAEKIADIRRRLHE
jgi:hypothetical protein